MSATFLFDFSISQVNNKFLIQIACDSSWGSYSTYLLLLGLFPCYIGSAGWVFLALMLLALGGLRFSVETPQLPVHLAFVMVTSHVCHEICILLSETSTRNGTNESMCMCIYNILYYIILYYIILYYTILYYIILYCFILYYIILYYIIYIKIYYIILCFIILLYYVILYYIILFYIILYIIILYYITLNYIILYYVLLYYYIMLYYIILY